MHFLRWGSVIVLLLAAVGCGEADSPTDPGPVYTQTTETFSGTLAVGAKSPFPFTVENPGDVNVAITALSPTSTVTMGLRLGGWDPAALTCTSQLETSQARLNQVFSGTPNAPGQYCVEIYDIGNLQESTDFVLTLTHF